MALGLVGKKAGMTRVFTEDGVSIPVTVVTVESNRITQIKNSEKDGYFAVQITAGVRKSSRVNKAMAGHFVKAGVEAGVGLWEFRVSEAQVADLELAQALSVDLFEAGQSVDVAGTTKGKGFAGTVKRYGFSMQDATHGNSLSHRAPGSIGQCQDPGRVFKGKKMAGRMGGKRRTVQNLDIVRVDSDRGALLIKGAIPGATGQLVILSPSVKRKAKREG